MDKKKVSIFVAGQRFNIMTEDEEKYVLDIAKRVDARISSIVLSQSMNRERAAVLTALDFADDGEQLKKELAEIREQVKDYLDQIQRSSEKLTAREETNADLFMEIDGLTNKNKELTEQRDKLETEKSEISAQYDALKAENTKLEEKKAELEAKIAELIQQAEELKKPAEKAEIAEPQPVPETKEENEEKAVTAEDDLFFDSPGVPEPAPIPKKEKKNRHEHNHGNPYRDRFMREKDEAKGYTQQRQYSLFDDINE